MGNLIDPFSIPLLNTTLLLARGITVTWAHHKRESLRLIITIILGVVFLGLQVIEYRIISLTISDSSFGRSFYALTGLHGFHVFVGVIILLNALSIKSDNLG